LIERPRGTHDVLPAEHPLWRRIIDEAERLCARYGYRPILTPVFEDTDLFLRTSGAGSDVVQKEMYTFKDRGDRSLTLRPEATAPIARAYVEHGMHRLPQPVKLYTVGSMYRYAAPQRGRYREHWQLSVEGLGSDDPALDAEVIQLYDELLANLGVTQYELRLNSIGDRNCRPAYLERLREWADEHRHELGEEAQQKLATTPLRVFDIDDPETQSALARAPKIGDSLCEECREHFARVRGFLEAYGVAFRLVPTLVRGLDYYTRTTWEFVGPHERAQSTISGGGRYDGLVEEIGGPPTPGIGFGAGIERLLLALEAEGAEVEQPSIDVFFVCEAAADRERVLPLLAELRRRGLKADLDYAGRSFKGQVTQAARLGAGWTVIVDGNQATVREQGKQDWTTWLDGLIERIAG
jgi:histidyl-tRNA synthetase